MCSMVGAARVDAPEGQLKAPGFAEFRGRVQNWELSDRWLPAFGKVDRLGLDSHRGAG